MALNIIGFLQCFEAFGEAARAFTGAPECEQEQEQCERDGAVAESRPGPRVGGEPSEERTNHRRPRFQSSSRA